MPELRLVFVYVKTVKSLLVYLNSDVLIFVYVKTVRSSSHRFSKSAIFFAYCNV